MMHSDQTVNELKHFLMFIVNGCYTDVIIDSNCCQISTIINTILVHHLIHLWCVCGVLIVYVLINFFVCK